MNESREEFEARLVRSLRGGAAKQSAAPKSESSLPEWYLRRLARDAQRAASRCEDSPGAAAAQPRANRFTRGMPERIDVEENTRGRFGVRIERLGVDFVHGSGPLGDVLSARGEPLAILTGDESLAGFDPREATFLDIETTGLGGGAGCQVFQIGLLSFEASGFELWQGFLRSPAEAPALLEACAQRVGCRGPLVSFFGKSFDRHRLEDQMRLHRVEPPFRGRAHLDLYHPCRRVYGKAFADGRLATMERELCGVRREGDLSGAFAPAAWFDFLAGREHALEAVFLHNRLDVLSLASLCAHVARVLDDRHVDENALAGPPAKRAAALTELFAARRDWPRVLEWSARVLTSTGDHRRTLACRARALLRCGRLDEANTLLETLASSLADGLAAEACAELARLALRSGRFDAAVKACCDAERIAATTLTGARGAKLASKIETLRARLAKAAR